MTGGETAKPQTGSRSATSIREALSSASAMVFMEDSERAAAMAREREIDCGLHLNFTTPFSAPGTPLSLLKHQHRLSAFWCRHCYAQVVFHPALVGLIRMRGSRATRRIREAVRREAESHRRSPSYAPLLQTYTADILVTNDQTSTRDADEVLAGPRLFLAPGITRG